MTPLLVPIHSRLQETIRAVIRTKEKPSFPVPSIFETYGSISTSCMCSNVCVWYRRKVESKLTKKLYLCFNDNSYNETVIDRENKNKPKNLCFLIKLTN